MVIMVFLPQPGQNVRCHLSQHSGMVERKWPEQAQRADPSLPAHWEGFAHCRCHETLGSKAAKNPPQWRGLAARVSSLQYEAQRREGEGEGEREGRAECGEGQGGENRK